MQFEAGKADKGLPTCLTLVALFFRMGSNVVLEVIFILKLDATKGAPPSDRILVVFRSKVNSDGFLVQKGFPTSQKRARVSWPDRLDVNIFEMLDSFTP